MKITADDLRSLSPRYGNRDIINALAAAQGELAPFGIDTPLRICHFWAQAAHETDGFKTLIEYASGSAYEGRKDLGNTQLGDGKRYKGRGIFQLTGRANYAAMGKRLGIDLIGHPELAAEPLVAIRIAAIYWQTRSLNTLADKNDLRGITKKINGGFNGLEQRRAYFNQAWKLWGDRKETPAPAKTMATSKTGNAAAATGATGVAGAYAAFQAGKDVVANAGEVREAASNAGLLLGLSGWQAMALGAALLVVAGCAFIWWERRRKLVQEGV